MTYQGPHRFLADGRCEHRWRNRQRRVVSGCVVQAYVDGRREAYGEYKDELLGADHAYGTLLVEKQELAGRLADAAILAVASAPCSFQEVHERDIRYALTGEMYDSGWCHCGAFVPDSYEGVDDCGNCGGQRRPEEAR